MFNVEKLKARQEEIKGLRKEGCTFKQIAGVFKLSRQRIHQILNTNYDKPLKPNNLEREPAERLVDRYPQLRILKGREYNRELVRIRDNHTCQLCGYKWKEGERRLDIHHLDCKKEKTRQYDRPIEFRNMITLCHKCHLNIPAHKQTMRDASRGLKQAEKETFPHFQ
jgi:hypothetical protein